MQNRSLQLYLDLTEAKTFEEKERIRREILELLQNLDEKEAEWWLWLLTDYIRIKKDYMRLIRKLELIRELTE